MRHRALLLGSFSIAVLFATQCSESSSGPPIASIAGTTPPASGGASIAGNESAQADAGALTNVQPLVAALQRALDANASSYGEVDLEDLSDLLTHALLRAQRPGGRGAASARCAQTALLNGFTPAQASTLCADMIEDSATCATSAVLGGFGRDAAVTLCTRRGEPTTADCATTALRVLGSPAQATTVCADRDGTTTVQCVAAAITTGFDHDQAVALCAHRGSLATATCAIAATQSLGFTRDDAVALCADRGTAETASCAGTAVLSLAFSRPDAIALCAGRGESSNVTCALDLRSSILTRAQTIATCRRLNSAP